MAARFGILARSFSTGSVSQQLVKPPVQVFGLEGRYASALYSAAVKKSAVDAVEKDLKTFDGLLKTDTILKDFILNPLLSKDLRKAAIDSVLTKKNANELTKNLFGAMIENGRLSNTQGVIGAFSTIMSAVRGEVICEVTTAKPLDGPMKADLNAALKAFLKEGETLQITTKVDPAIIGGMIVSIGDKYVDMSMASKIKKYNDLIEAAV
ncbi:ATP synthase subunit O, mitochondrial [Oratosquilla oratoria]|uniref:ATP synthase subunit O, mitochondrial n=1 Tax=Oratosquilla oratoria TaxID=337810 RepID=UPI003F76CA4C